MTETRPATRTAQAFMVTEAMINERNWSRGNGPFYSVDQTAKVFFAMSASWLRLKLKKDPGHPETWFTDEHGSQMNFRRNKPEQGSRVFTLADIEPMAWSLFWFGGITVEKLAHIVHVVEAEAILWGLITPSPAGEPG